MVWDAKFSHPTLSLQVSSQRLSVGMTPKTLRLPKPGEMLLSVHGSPLGVYKEDNMEAIHGTDSVPTSTLTLDILHWGGVKFSWKYQI